MSLKRKIIFSLITLSIITATAEISTRVFFAFILKKSVVAYYGIDPDIKINIKSLRNFDIMRLTSIKTNKRMLYIFSLQLFML